MKSLAAWIAGEPHSASPSCVCPVLSDFMRAWNDDLPTDADRDRLLKPVLPRLIGSRSTPEVELRRSQLALDWFVRTSMPTVFDLVDNLKPMATKLRALAPMLSHAAIHASDDLIAEAAREAAASRAASWDASWDAVEQLAAAKKVAVSDLAYREVYDAVYAACAALFAPTRATLERSALELIDAMLAVTPATLAAEADA